MYRLDVTVPIVPNGGEIQITFDTAKLSSSSGAHCRVKTNFVKSTDDTLALRCFLMTGGFRIGGFTAMTTGTPISIYFMVKSLAALTT